MFSLKISQSQPPKLRNATYGVDNPLKFHTFIEHEPAITANLENSVWLSDSDITDILARNFGFITHTKSADGTIFNVVDKNLKTPILRNGELIQDSQLNLTIKEFKDDLTANKLCAIVNIGDHWISLIGVRDKIDSQKVYFLYHNSFGTNIPESIESQLNKTFGKRNITIKSIQETQQTDTHSCGYYAILNTAFYYGVPNDGIIEFIKTPEPLKLDSRSPKVPKLPKIPNLAKKPKSTSTKQLCYDENGEPVIVDSATYEQSIGKPSNSYLPFLGKSLSDAKPASKVGLFTSISNNLYVDDYLSDDCSLESISLTESDIEQPDKPKSSKGLFGWIKNKFS